MAPVQLHGHPGGATVLGALDADADAGAGAGETG